MLHAISTLVLLMLAVGIYFRRRREIHMKLMTSAFAIDLALVLYIELTRHAVETVATQTKPLLWFHATVSTSVLVLYVVMFALGRRLAAAPAANAVTSAGPIATGHLSQTRNLHRNLGMAFCALRVLNYVTAFMV